MDATYTQALNAYQNRLKAMDAAVPEEAGGDQAGKTSFSDLLGNVIDSAINTQYDNEKLQMQSLTGTQPVELTDLVTAVAEAELALNTVVAVRDRVISAYQDIIRMPI